MANKLDYSDGEKLLSIGEAIERVTGQRPHPTTCSRWVRRGSQGIVLASVLVGTRRLTTEKAVREWIDEKTEAAAIPA